MILPDIEVDYTPDFDSHAELEHIDEPSKKTKRTRRQEMNYDSTDIACGRNNNILTTETRPILAWCWECLFPLTVTHVQSLESLHSRSSRSRC